MRRAEEENDDHALGPVDADDLLIADYLANELSEADRVAFEDRLDVDEVFQAKMLPVIELFRASRAAHERARDATRRTVRAARVRQAGAVASGIAAMALVFVLAMKWQQRATKTDPAPIGALAADHVVRTGAVETKTLVLEDSTVIELHPMSTFSYSQRWRRGYAVFAHLEGEVVVNMAYNSQPMRIEGNGGVADLRMGNFTVRSFAGSGELLVDVRRGSALLARAKAATRDWLTVLSGQLGRARADSAPALVKGRLESVVR